MENYSIHKKRLRQLDFEKKKEDANISDLVDTVTKPIINHVFSRFKPKNLEELERQLRMAKWDKNFTPIQYRALNLLLKGIGVLAFLLFSQASMFMAVLWGFILIFVMDILFKNSVVNRRERIFNDFPEFIRIVEGYLTANMPFPKAVEESIKYVGDEWKPILKQFVIECEIKSIDEALDFLKEDVDLFEMREFVAIVKLNLEQGGDAKDSFSAQAEKIREMQMDLIAIKIGKRQTMGILVQAPLLLCNMAVLGLPVVDSFSNMAM
jgi:Flp pilus assembly protein TadB